ncbi:MAG: hypothetical protein ILO34_04615, partial [Kiritimatiellae bacterium]|nr:hypothetical protein [Kiritimatiellia bacterium]
TSYSYTMPEGWGSSIFALRFFLRDGVYRYEPKKLVSPLGAKYNLGYVPTSETRATVKTTIKTKLPSVHPSTYTADDALYVCEGDDPYQFAFIPADYESQFRASNGWGWIYVYSVFPSLSIPYTIETGVFYWVLNGNFSAGEVRSDLGFTYSTPLVLYSNTCVGDLFYFRLREQEDGGAAFADTYFDDGTCTAYFVPVVDLDGNSCLYDKVGGRFVYNSGSGTPSARGRASDIVATCAYVDRSEVFALSDPYVENPPEISYDPVNGFTVSATLTSGIGDVEISYDGGAYAQTLGVDQEGPAVLSASVIAFPADTSHTFAAIAKVGEKTIATIPSPKAFYTGTPSISVGAVAVPKTSTSGYFTVSRADSNGDLYVNYTVGGTAVAGADYGALSGVAVIPDGESSVDIAIDPKWGGPSSTVSSTIVITLASGFYATPMPAPSATMTLAPSGKPLAGNGFTKFFNVKATGFDGANGLDNFPALVRISEELIYGFDYNDVDGDGGYGLQFRDALGNVLDYEVDTWNPSGESLIWVGVPSLDDSDTVLRCFYSLADKNAELPAVASSNVWLNAGYVGVFHMNMAEGETYAADSTGNRLDAYSQSGLQRPGVVGLARYNGMPAAVNGGPQIRVPSYDSLLPSEKTSAVSQSVSGWFKAESVNQGNARIFSGKAYNSEDVAWSIEFPNINTIYMRGHSEAAGQFQVNCPDISADWVRFDFVFDDVYASVYTNGYAIVFNHGT